MKIYVLMFGPWLLFAISGFLTSCLSQDVDRQLLTNVSLSPEWLEFEADPPLKASRQVQMIVLVTAEPFKPDFDSRGLVLGGCTIVVPEIQIVDEDGNNYVLKTQTLSGDMEAAYWMVELPADRKYTKVRLRSNHPLNCKSVIWRCHNSQ